MPTVIEWVKHLESKIAAQTAYGEPFERRYRNEHVLPFIQREYAEVYGQDNVAALMGPRPPQSGTAGVVVDAIVERLTVLGATSDDRDAAKRVEQAWMENDLDVMHREAHREASIGGRSFAQVIPSSDGERAVVGIESYTQMAVHRQSAPPYDVDAALKITVDEWTGKRKARLWLPGRDIDLAEAPTVQADPEKPSVVSRWVIAEDYPNRLGVVPVVEFQNRPRLLVEPQSEIEQISSSVDLVDLIDGLMVFAGHFGAVPIRFGTGLEPARDPKDPTKLLFGPDGKPILGFNARADHFWGTTSKDAEFGQLTPAGLESFVKWAEHASSRIRSKTGVASAYFSLDLKSHMSAELFKTDEAPMVRRINAIGRDGTHNQGWRRVNRLILMIETPNSTPPLVLPRWDHPQTRIESQDADVFAKVSPQLGPVTTGMKVLGWSREMAEKGASEAEAIRNAAADPVAAALGKPIVDDAPTGNA